MFLTAVRHEVNNLVSSSFAGLGMWRVRVVQSEQHMICRLTASGGREAQANMEETDRERLP